MLKIFEDYAKDFNLIFNASKSKCVICQRHGAAQNKSVFSTSRLAFKMRDDVIEVVSNWLHLGHIMSDDGDDKLDILNRLCCFIGQANNLICISGKLYCSVKTRLQKSFCFNFYGCDVWDLSNATRGTPRLSD